MKMFVFAQHLEIGGTQVSSIELAAALRDVHGFDVVLFAGPGPMTKLVEKKNLRLFRAPRRVSTHHQHASVLFVVLYGKNVRILFMSGIGGSAYDAYYALHLRLRLPMVVTDMMMRLTRLLPKVRRHLGHRKLSIRRRPRGADEWNSCCRLLTYI